MSDFGCTRCTLIYRHPAKSVCSIFMDDGFSKDWIASLCFDCKTELSLWIKDSDYKIAHESGVIY